jgi:3-methyl-2-oxobutanoate hydroxymethyltransferase
VQGNAGQVLVYHDVLGIISHSHRKEFIPIFCKKYAQVAGRSITQGQLKKEI